MGTGVLAAGDASNDAGVSLGVESAEADVREGAGDVMRKRFGSGCSDPLSCDATDASLGVSAGLSVAGGGEVSRFRLFKGFEGCEADFFL